MSETVLWQQDGPVGRITLNRPDSLNAWTAEFGAALRDIVLGEAADPSVRAVVITGAGRGFSSGADLKAGFDPHPEDGYPDVKKELHDVYHPAIAGIRRLPKPVVACERAGRRHRLLARPRLRSGARRRVGLLRPRVREHRSDAGRWLDAVRARGRRQVARLPDGAAGRAD